MPLRPSNPPARCAVATLATLAAMAAIALCAPPAAAADQASPPAHRHRNHHPSHVVPRRAAEAPAYGDRADVLHFADDVAGRTGLPRAWLAMELAQARRIEATRQLVMPPPSGVAKNWASYRARFIEPRRIAAGEAFWRDNARWLAVAEQRFGVPAEIVVGLIGVETFYGRLTGRFRVIDTLATLAFDFPAERSDRSGFFRGELEQFFVLCAREGVDPQQPRGSFAGAMGLAQFMPGSINRHAVDLDADGHVDLDTDVADAVGSVANYLAESGWQRGEPTHFAVTASADATQRAQLLAPDVKPSFSAAQMAALGAALDGHGRRYAGPLALIELDNGDAPPSYVAGTPNFYAITRYNRSSYYAMAVIELGEAVRRAMPALPDASSAAPPAVAQALKTAGDESLSARPALPGR